MPARSVLCALLFAACASNEGGIKLSYRAVPGAKAVVEKRLRKLMLRRVHVLEEGDTLAVYVPGGSRVDDVKQSLATPGALQISFVVEGPVSAPAGDTAVTVEHDPDTSSAWLHGVTREAVFAAAKTAALPAGRVLVSADDTGFRTWVLDEEPVLTGASITEATDSVSAENIPELGLTLDDAGKVSLADATARGVGRRMAIILDGQVLSAPKVMGRIPGGRLRVSLGAKAQLIDARALASALKSGALPQPLVLEKEETYAPRKF